MSDTGSPGRANDLQRAVNEFYAVLDSLQWQGVSPLAEIKQLEALVRKHPDTARRLLQALDRRPASHRP